jgi:outer membrane immunogenic protein
MRRILLFAVTLVAGLSATASLAQGVLELSSSRAIGWTGFYVGIHGGYGWASDDVIEFDASTGQPTGFFRWIFSDEGAEAGVHAGYSQQHGIIVVGLEGDVEFVDVGGTVFDPFGGSFETRRHWNASLRARLGVLPLDRLLVYATAGLAATEVESRFILPPLGEDERFRAGAVGLTLGAGVEFALTDQLTIRGEYRYADFGTTRYDWPKYTTYYRHVPESHSVRMGLSYRF